MGFVELIFVVPYSLRKDWCCSYALDFYVGDTWVQSLPRNGLSDFLLKRKLYFVSMYIPYWLLNAWTNLLKLGVSWHLDSISTTYFMNPSEFLYLYPILLLGNASIKPYRGKECTHNSRRSFGRVVFHAIHVISKQGRRLGLPRTFFVCFQLCRRIWE